MPQALRDRDGAREAWSHGWKHMLWERWPGTLCADSGLGLCSAELMLLELAGRQALKPAGAGCMEKSGCSPFPVCWAKGTSNLKIGLVYILFTFTLCTKTVKSFVEFISNRFTVKLKGK